VAAAVVDLSLMVTQAVVEVPEDTEPRRLASLQIRLTPSQLVLEAQAEATQTVPTAQTAYFRRLPQQAAAAAAVQVAQDSVPDATEDPAVEAPAVFTLVALEPSVKETMVEMPIIQPAALAPLVAAAQQQPAQTARHHPAVTVEMAQHPASLEAASLEQAAAVAVCTRQAQSALAAQVVAVTPEQQAVATATQEPQTQVAVAVVRRQVPASPMTAATAVPAS